MASRQPCVCALLMAALLVATGCAEKAPERPPNVLFVLVDTLRADRLGRGELTPFLDELAERGTVFRNAYSTSSWTLPAIATLFTSRYQADHGVVSFRSPIVADEVTLAEAFTGGGYRSIGYSASPLLGKPRGYAQGFEYWKVFRPKKFHKRERPLVRARVLSTALLNGLDSTSEQGAAPIFVYAHYVDPHSPYDPPRALRGRFVGDEVDDEAIADVNEKLRKLKLEGLTPAERTLLEALYDAEVAYFDTELRSLFDALEARGFLDNAIVVITSDHGEEFFEHELALHGLTLYEESVRVPLIMLGRGIPKRGVIEGRVSLVDIAPTLLDLAGLPEEPRFAGRSLVPLMRGREPALARPIALELAAKGEKVDFRVHAQGLILGSNKIVVRPDGEPAFYDLDLDAREQHAVDAAHTPAAADLLEGLVRVDASAPKTVDGATTPRTAVEPSEEEKAHLRALGYLVE